MREAWNISSSLCSDDQHHYFPRLPLQSPVLWHVSHACGHGECESSLLEQPHEQQVKATAQGERICVLPSFLTDLQHFTSVVCLPLPVMDLDWLYFPCFHICSPYLYAGFYSYIISLRTIFWPVCTAPTLLKPGPRLGLVGIAVIQLKDDNNHLASCYTCLERAG